MDRYTFDDMKLTAILMEAYDSALDDIFAPWPDEFQPEKYDVLDRDIKTKERREFEANLAISPVD